MPNHVAAQVRMAFEERAEPVGSPVSNASDEVTTSQIVKSCLESIITSENDVAGQICRLEIH